MIICFSCVFASSYSQLGCQSKKVNDKQVKICYHSNNKLSTIETWDLQKRSGSIQAFENTGKLLFEYGLRTFAGHASVDIKYHPNGQVSKAEYRSAPDGGIQFWHIITEYSMDGKETNKIDLSQPDGHPVLMVPDKNNTNKPVVTKTEEYVTVFKIFNATGNKVSVDFKASVNNENIKTKNNSFVLKPKQTQTGDSISAAKFYTPDESFFFELSQSQTSKKKLQLILSTPETKDKKRVYSWYVIEK